MKRGDIVWGLLLASLLVLFVIPATRDSILAASSAHPYIGGFVQFSILATMGDLFGKRIASGDYHFCSGSSTSDCLGDHWLYGNAGFSSIHGRCWFSTGWEIAAFCWRFVGTSFLWKQYYESYLCASDEYVSSYYGAMDRNSSCKRTGDSEGIDWQN